MDNNILKSFTIDELVNELSTREGVEIDRLRSDVGMDLEVEGPAIVIVIDKEEYDEDRLMETVMEAPIEDFVTEESVYEIYTAPDEDFRTTRDFLRDKDYTFISAEEEQVPSSYSSIDSEEAKDKMQRLLDMLEDDDDVQNVYHNWDEE